MQTFRMYLISLIRTCKVMNKKVLLCCTANQSGTGYKLHFQPKKLQHGPNWQQSSAKMAVARLRCGGKVPKCFITLILTYNVIKETVFLRCTANQSGTSHRFQFHLKQSAWPKLAANKNKNGCGTDEV